MQRPEIGVYYANDSCTAIFKIIEFREDKALYEILDKSGAKTLEGSFIWNEKTFVHFFSVYRKLSPLEVELIL